MQQQQEKFEEILEEEKTYQLDEQGIPRNNKVYREKNYWNFRFKTEQQYDWIADLSAMEKNSQGFLEEFVAKLKDDKKILNLGNGTSTMPLQLCEKGVRSENLVNCDYVENVIEKMKAIYKDQCGQWVVADIRKLEAVFEPQSFDVIVEKCTLDALTVSPKDPWKPDEELRETVKSVFRGAHRLLKNKGDIFISLSFEQPHFRKKYFDEEIQELFTDLEVQRKIEVGWNECYVYYFKKK